MTKSNGSGFMFSLRLTVLGCNSDMGCPSACREFVLLSWLIKKLNWPIVKQSRVKREIQARIKGKRRQSLADASSNWKNKV